MSKQLRVHDVVTGAGGFGNHGHASEKGRRDFFEHTPSGEVKGIDMNRCAPTRHPNMQAVKTRGPCQGLRLPIGEDIARPFLAQSPVIGQCAHGPIDVELGVRARVSTILDADVDPLFPFLIQCPAHGQETGGSA